MDLVVGFDLDMTLLDTRPGIAATYRALIEATGVQIDVDLVVNRLGPGLPDEMANWFPPAEVDAAVRLYRSMYPSHAIESAVVLPGAREAVASVHALGGTVAVITAKIEPLARLHFAHVGFDIDQVVGNVFGPGKQQAITDLGVEIYVGDHVADARAATAAGPWVTAVGVTTGPCDAAQLAEAGASVVMADLTGFPGWLAERYRMVLPQQAHRL